MKAILKQNEEQNIKNGFPWIYRNEVASLDGNITSGGEVKIYSSSGEFFNTKRIIKLLDDHKNGKRDNSRKIWTIYTFLIWYNEYFIKR